MNEKKTTGDLKITETHAKPANQGPNTRGGADVVHLEFIVLLTLSDGLSSCLARFTRESGFRADRAGRSGDISSIDSRKSPSERSKMNTLVESTFSVSDRSMAFRDSWRRSVIINRSPVPGNANGVSLMAYLVPHARAMTTRLRNYDVPRSVDFPVDSQEGLMRVAPLGITNPRWIF